MFRAYAFQVEQWAYDKWKIILSSDVKVKSKSSTKTVHSGNESWEGHTCDILLWHYDKLLDRAFQDSTRPSDLEEAKTIWQSFSVFLTAALKGCDDEDKADCERHGAELRELAEEFVDNFTAAAGPESATVYMHEMLCHIEDTVSEYGSLAKFSSQAIEAWHQIMKDLVAHFSNNNPHQTAGTCLERALAWCNTDVLRNHKGTVQGASLGEEGNAGNSAHLSKALLKVRDERRAADLEALQQWRAGKGSSNM